MTRKYSQARAEIALHPGDAELAEALAVIDRLQKENTALSVRLVEAERTKAWSEGRRGDGVDRAPGFTVTQTRVLRILAATGEIRYARMESSLQRHMSNIRKRLPPGVVIKTIIGVGYEVVEGMTALRALVSAKRSPVRPLDSVALSLVA